MKRFHSLNAIRSYLGAQSRARDEKKPSRRRPPATRFVTVSRQAGAGGTSVAVALARLLNAEEGSVPWTVFDRELVKAVIHHHGLPREVERFLTEDAVPELQTIFTEFFGGVTSRRGLTARTSETILRLARMGRAILVGRASHIVTRRLPGGLHVRLIASTGRRIERIRKLTGQSESEARTEVASRDRGRRSYVRKYFRSDVTDPMEFDLVLNTDRLTYIDAARVIRAALDGAERLRSARPGR
ncbi:MAG: cytidylate kinase-like family protein [Planctomycetota bacterium]